MDLDKVIKLFLDPNSQDLHERHTVAVQRLCEANVAGFPMRDLPKTQHVLELTLGLLRAGFPEYLEPACQLLRCAAPRAPAQPDTSRWFSTGAACQILTQTRSSLNAQDARQALCQAQLD